METCPLFLIDINVTILALGSRIMWFGLLIRIVLRMYNTNPEASEILTG